MHKKPADQNQVPDIDPGLLNRILNLIGLSKKTTVVKPSKYSKKGKGQKMGTAMRNAAAKKKRKKEISYQSRKLNCMRSRGKA